MKSTIAFFIVFVLVTGLCVTGQTRPDKVEASDRVVVELVTDEADAALNILAKKKSAQQITEADWQRLFDSEGYRRLKKREAAMERSFDDADFKAFMLSDDLLQRSDKLSKTLGRWQQANPRHAAQQALAYLPRQAQIRAKIYPVIKPRTNSFVFEIDSDPAIFLYLDPEVTNEQFENTIAHEFHHIGYGTTCPATSTKEAIASLSSNKQTALKWLGAFGEGFAMLAAAGGPDVHPHANSKKEDRERWDRDAQNFENDLRKVEKFFLDVLRNRLNEEQTRTTAFSFYGVQGPWYTVGWKMAVTIERAYGRERLIECMCDQRQLLSTYNSAAAKLDRGKLPLWSSELLDGIR